MRRFWPVLIFAVFFLVAKYFSSISATHTPLHPSAQRIISLAPSITETVFALGLGPSVIAVTDYCDYPPQAQGRLKIGGGLTPNLEKIIALNPDLVILLASQTQLIKQLQHLSIPILAVKMTRLSDILDAITQIGAATHHVQQALTLVQHLKQHFQTISRRVADLPHPTVLIVLGHSLDQDTINTLYIAGQHDFYNDLITLAGGRNAYQSMRMKVPAISLEGLLQLDPDVIIDIFPDADDHHTDLTITRQRWSQLQQLKAVQHHRVYLLEKDYATIPGPRIDLLLADLAALIHPEMNRIQTTP